MGNKPQKVFVNHGDENAADNFVSELKTLGYDAFAPFSGTEFDLKTGEFTNITKGIRIERKTFEQSSKSNVLYHNLLESTRRLQSFAKDLDGIPNKDLKKFTEQINALIAEFKSYK